MAVDVVPRYFCAKLLDIFPSLTSGGLIDIFHSPVVGALIELTVFFHLRLKEQQMFLAQCHVRIREILSYLQMPKTTSMFYMYEATIVKKILMPVL